MPRELLHTDYVFETTHLPPAPQGFIPQPPPAPYPPNGAGGPRGSMPPTPMQQHAYAFHQSPQRAYGFLTLLPCP